MNYRPDIDGLRALAVLPVIFFHAGHPWFTGGFLGVDVFFVISGYLITTMILKSLIDSNFRFLDFYDRRARRILPLLFLVVAVTTIFSFFFMLPNELKSYGQSLVATILSANNILLYLTSGYWSLAAEFKPLYHTWSLGVEEHFYLIIPLIFYIMYKVIGTVKSIGVGLVFLALVSFYYSLSIENAEFNFLMIFSRAWELLVGSLVAIIFLKRTVKGNSYLALIGLVMIMASYGWPYMISDAQAIVNMPAVFGTALIILYSKNEGNFVWRLLSWKPLVSLGILSYGVYLWHQPILAFIRLSSEREPGYLYLMLMGLFSIPLSYLSWRFVERPLRDRRITSTFRFYSIITLAGGILILVGVFLHLSFGLEGYRKEFTYGGNPRSYVDRAYKLNADKFGENERKKVFVIGNSFARDITNTIIEYMAMSNVEVEVIYKHADYEALNNEYGKLAGQSDLVIIAQSWGQEYFDPEEANRLASFRDEFSEETGVDVYVVGGKNFGWNNNFVLRHAYNEARSLTARPLKTVLDFNGYAGELIGEWFIDIPKLLMDEHGQVPIFTDSGMLITYDTNHLTPEGARFLANVLYNETKLSVVFDEHSGQSQ